MADNSLILSALVPLLVGLFFFLRRKDTRTDFPPGPSPIPILGNIHQLPLQKSFFKLTEWGREYGPIVGLQLGPQKAVVLNTWTAVRDLLDQRGAIYSSRPSIPIVQHMELADAHAALMKYDKNWRRARKTIAEFLKDSEVEKRAEVQNAEATQMIWEIMTNPGEYREHVMRSFAAVVLATVYGRRGKHAETNRFFEINGEWSALLDPGAVPPLDVFPFLKYVPDWLTPWRGWRERADDLKRNQDAEYTELFQHARDRVAQGKADDSFVARLLMEQENEGYTDHELEHIAGLLLEGGSETSAMTFLTFMLAMIGFPESQKRAQEEVDAVFGEWKMPDEIDATKLPYLTACFWEVS
jgi:cytochrome P450